MGRGDLKGTGLVDALVATLRTGDDIAARGAAEALGKLGTAAAVAVPDLIAALTDRRGQVEFKATVALGQIGDVRAIGPLIGVLASSWPASRREAVRALGALGGADAMRAVAVMLRDVDRHVRAASAKLLGVSPPDGKRVEIERSAAIAVVDAEWRGNARTCPKCQRSFIAQQSRCRCPDCLTDFYASHLANPHEYPFEALDALLRQSTGRST